MESPVGKKGYTGNPGGRKPMDPELKKSLQGWAAESLKFLYGLMQNEDAANRDRAKAAEVLMDRAWGKPLQSVDAEIRDLRPILFDSALGALVKRDPQP